MKSPPISDENFSLKMKKQKKIAIIIIAVGILLWLAQESVFFVYDTWVSNNNIMIFYIILVYSDWIGVLPVLFFLISQLLKKDSGVLNFLAQIGLYCHILAILIAHFFLGVQFLTITILSTVSLIFLLVYHIIHKIKKRNHKGYLLQIQAIVLLILAVFDLIVGHAGRYVVPSINYRLGLTFLPVVLEFILILAIIIYQSVKSGLVEKHQKIVTIVLSSIGLVGLIASYTSWDVTYPLKLAGDGVIVIGVLYYLLISLLSLKNFYQMRKQNIS